MRNSQSDKTKIFSKGKKAMVNKTTKKTKVAIVGFAPTTRHQAPFFDNEFEIWGLNELYMCIPRFDRWFEMHSRQEYENSLRNKQHLEWLQCCGKPIYMQKEYADIPMSVKFPKDPMVREYGYCFRSTICYMLALAIHEHFSEIHLYGVDSLNKVEYYDERPSIEYLLGIAKGKGIEVVIPSDSSFLRSSLYGYDPYTAAEKYDLRLNELAARKRKLKADLHVVVGAIRERLGHSPYEESRRIRGTTQKSQVMSKKPLGLGDIRDLNYVKRRIEEDIQFVTGAINESRYWLSQIRDI